MRAPIRSRTERTGGSVPTSLSVTVAVHVVEELVLMDDGLHTTAVRVLRLFTATVVLPALVEWLLSPP